MDEPSPLPTTEPEELELLSSPESPEELLPELFPELLDLCEELPELLLLEDLLLELPEELPPLEVPPPELLLLELPLFELLALFAACCWASALAAAAAAAAFFLASSRSSSMETAFLNLTVNFTNSLETKPFVSPSTMILTQSLSSRITSKLSSPDTSVSTAQSVLFASRTFSVSVFMVAIDQLFCAETDR